MVNSLEKPGSFKFDLLSLFSEEFDNNKANKNRVEEVSTKVVTPSESNEDAFESIDINDSDDFENDEHKSSSFKRIKDATAKIGSMFDGFRQKTNSIQRLRNLKQEDKCNQLKEANTKIPAEKPGKAPTNLEDKKSNRNENSKNTDSNAEMIKILANKAVNGAKELFHMPWNYQAQETANKTEETKRK